MSENNDAKSVEDGTTPAGTQSECTNEGEKESTSSSTQEENDKQHES